MHAVLYFHLLWNVAQVDLSGGANRFEFFVQQLEVLILISAVS